MSMKVRERDDNIYLYFQEKDGKTIFLGKIDEITKYPDRTIKAYNEISKKYSKYLEDTIKLISILPPQKREKYISKLRSDFESKEIYLSSLSPSAAKQYKPKGLVKADEETRRRQEKIKHKPQTSIVRTAKFIPVIKIPNINFLKDELCYTAFCSLWSYCLDKKIQYKNWDYVTLNDLKEITEMERKEVEKLISLLIQFDFLRVEERHEVIFNLTSKGNDIIENITDRFIDENIIGVKNQIEALEQLGQFVKRLLKDDKLHKQYGKKLAKLLNKEEIRIALFTEESYQEEKYRGLRLLRHRRIVDEFQDEITKKETSKKKMEK